MNLLMRTRLFGRYLVPAIVIVAILSGCSANSSKPDKSPPPVVSLKAPKQCDVCGMVIENHHGPGGQIFYEPDDLRHDTNPFQFDSIKHGLLPHYVSHKRMGWSPVAVYVTDYSRFDYSVETVRGDSYIRRAVAPETFAPVDQVVFVVGSRVHGAMGRDYIPFSDRDQARQFTDTHGGKLRQFEELAQERLTR